MWSKNKKLVLLLILTALLVVTAVSALLISVLPGYRAAKSTMDPDGTVTVAAGADGTLRLEWPAGENAQRYKLQILDADGKVLHTDVTESCSAVLPELPEDQQLRARITACHDYGKRTRESREKLEAAFTLTFPQIGDLNWMPDAEAGTVDISFDMSGSDLCHVYMAEGDGEPVLVEQLQSGKTQLKFGEGEKYAIPDYDKPQFFSFRPERREGNVVYLGCPAEGFTLLREHLLGTNLNLRCTDNGENSYTLTWDETKGAYYDVRLSEDGGKTWMTMAYISVDRERTYTTPNLTAYADYLLQVVSVGGQSVQGNDVAAESETIELHTGAKLLYSTIWPLMDIRIFADAEATEELGTAAAGSAWCVLGQEGQMLKIRYQDRDAYLKSDYCMINLPEYLGNLCLYNITNSYSSIYTVHEYGISNVSGKVITGYEDVRIGEGEYLVPLLFPTAQKLLKAGEAAKEQGYTLKIYDSYRPKIATERLYSLTWAILKKTVPSYTYSGKNVKDLHLLDWDPYEEDEPVATETPTAPPAQENTPSPEEPAATQPPAENAEVGLSLEEIGIDVNFDGKITLTSGSRKPKPLTFEILMTNNGEYSLGKFLAPGTSRHNFGVAVDLTMVNAEGKELSMQTSMHDLSWYSAFKRNNSNANTLYKIMSGAGMTCISSEWWHYQDNEIYEKNDYKPLVNGVSWECWVADQNGWRYRLADGSFYVNCTQTIGEESYTFDEAGYLMK